MEQIFEEFERNILEQSDLLGWDQVQYVKNT